ncbi:protein kinase [Streptomyces hypolithicus]
MDDYAGRVLADRYRLPLPPSDAYELVETRAFDTYSGQEVLVRQVPLPEVVDAEFLDGEGGRAGGRATRRPADPAVRRAVEAAQAAAQIPDHPRLDQVFDVFAEGGSLWIVSELVAARPLAALLAERPLTPYRAAEIGSDVLTALRVLHAHGWTHRNITVRTVLVCDDGRIVLTGLAAGAAEEALCGYAPVPAPAEPAGAEAEAGEAQADGGWDADWDGAARYGADALPGQRGGSPAADAAHRAYGAPVPGGSQGSPEGGGAGGRPQGALPAGGANAAAEVRAARAGAIAAYRAGARAAARAGAEGPGGAGPLPGQRLAPRPSSGGPRAISPYIDVDADADADPDTGVDSGTAPPDSWHGAVQRAGAGDAMRADGLRRGQDHGTRPYAGTQPHPQQQAARLPQQHPQQQAAQDTGPARSWDEVVAGGQVPAYRGPATPLAAERARQARIALVGPVTERWAPEQAGSVHGNWQLAPPIGPSTDLWALGALLFRTVQGHAPYPEQSAIELVQLVCAEPPAFAEECGPLRPVVESLLRQDPTERPDFEELRGWLRSLVRSAPEPDAGADVVPLPSPDATRLPIVRRRGELVRRRRAGHADAQGRHRHKKARGSVKPVREPRPPREPRIKEPRIEPKQRGGPRSLGRTLLLVILLGLAAALAYALVVMPKAGQQGGSESDAQNAGDGRSTAAPKTPRPSSGSASEPPSTKDAPRETPGSQQPQTSVPATDVAKGYEIRKDPEGFQVAVDKDWERRPVNDAGQVRYRGDGVELLIVPGRDSVAEQGSDPMDYQLQKERELQPVRDSTWSTQNGLRRIDVGRQAMAEGQFTWQDSSGRDVYVRNLAMIVGDRYHVVQVIGPESERDRITEIYEQATKAYRVSS